MKLTVLIVLLACVCMLTEANFLASKKQGRGTPSGSLGNSPFESPSDSPFNSPFNSPNNSPFDSPNNSPFDSPNNSPFDSPPLETPGDTPGETPSSSNGPFLMAIVKDHGRTSATRYDIRTATVVEETAAEFTLTNTCSLRFQEYLSANQTFKKQRKDKENKIAVDGREKRGAEGLDLDYFMWSVAFNDSTSASQRQLFGASLSEPFLVEGTGTAIVPFENARVFITDTVQLVMDLGRGYIFNVTQNSFTKNIFLQQAWSLSGAYGDGCSASLDARHSTIWTVCESTIGEYRYDSQTYVQHDNKYNIQVAAFDEKHGELVGVAAAVDSSLVFAMTRQDDWNFLGVLPDINVAQPQNPQMILDSRAQVFTLLAQHGPVQRLATVSLNTLEILDDPIVSETVLSFCYSDDGYHPLL
jgi:hypothetical protein